MSIGKRKRDGGDSASDDEFEDESAMRARFQRAFEAKFKPLERLQPLRRIVEMGTGDANESNESDSDWSGLSADGDLVDVVHYDGTHDGQQQDDKLEKKAFMSAKPPTEATKPKTTRIQTTDPSKQDNETEASNLKHDLALQRLLKESHLLDPSSFHGRFSAPEGKGRLKSLDLRLKDLGAKESSSQQQKMPLAHRKGIVAKAAGRESKRRRDAVENGIVLEKAAKGTRARPARVEQRRERSVGGPTMGKFRSGTLKLSQRDLKSIERSGQSRTRGRKAKG